MSRPLAQNRSPPFLRCQRSSNACPSASAARLESSKWFAKEVMREANVATARAARYQRVDEALEALGEFGPPWVIKADGLAAGKGVTVCDDVESARAAIVEAMESGRFGESGRRVVLVNPVMRVGLTTTKCGSKVAEACGRTTRGYPPDQEQRSEPAELLASEQQCSLSQQTPTCLDQRQARNFGGVRG